jgi:hypothetical protein
MDPAEEIVNTWLQQQGFFVRNHVKVGYSGKEIDFLAVDVKRNKRVHVEVRVAVIPLGPFRPWGPAKYSKMPLKERVKLYYEDKFVGVVSKKEFHLKNRCIQEKAAEVFNGKDYERWLVLGVLHKRDSKQELERGFLKHGVKIFFIQDILKEICFEGTARDSTGRFLQLLAAQLTEESKKNLLKTRKPASDPSATHKATTKKQ